MRKFSFTKSTDEDSGKEGGKFVIKKVLSVKSSSSVVQEKGSSRSDFGSSSINSDRSSTLQSKSVGDLKVTSQTGQKHEEVEILPLKSRQRKCVGNEKSKINVNSNLLQKEDILTKKVQVWNSFFKNSQDLDKSGQKVPFRPFPKEKVVGQIEELKTKPNMEKNKWRS